MPASCTSPPGTCPPCARRPRPRSRPPRSTACRTSWGSAGSTGGIALLGSGQDEAGLADIERGKAELEAAVSRLLLNVGDLVASAHARAGRHEEASHHAREA